MDMRHARIALLAASALHAVASVAAKISVTLDGRDATGTYAEDGGVATAFEGSFASGAEKIAVSLSGGETRKAGEKFKTWRTNAHLEGIEPPEAVRAPLPPPGKWPSASGPGEMPRPFWEGHDDAVRCFMHAFEVVGRDCLREPDAESGFVRNYVYTPFGSSVFMWGTCFITMYGRYAEHVFPFADMLDNFYAKQDSDGFIPRQIDIHTGESAFEKHDLSSCGGDIMAWAEWREYEWTGDATRLAKAYPRLLAFHEWLRKHRTWKDGTYFSSGWGCGMDNVPRMSGGGWSPAFDHGRLSYADVTLRMLFDARTLVEIARVLGTDLGVAELEAEIASLSRTVREKMWDEEAGVFKDLDAEGRRTPVSHVGTYWALLCGDAAVDGAKARRLADQAFDPRRFGGVCGLVSTSADDPGFVPDGGNYWCGGCWCIMDYMAAKGFERLGMDETAHRIARRSVEAVAKVYAETGAIWESYSPAAFAPGKNWGHRVRKFVGFSGVSPVALFVENVLGVRATRTPNGENRILWDVRLKEPHGVEGLVLADGTRVSLSFDGSEAKCAADGPVEIEIRIGGRPAGTRRIGK